MSAGMSRGRSRIRSSPPGIVLGQLLIFLFPLSCAHTVKESLDVLSQAKSTECPSELDKLDDSKALMLPPNEWVEGELRESRCTSAVSRRSSWEIFRFMPKDTRADLEIRTRMNGKGLSLRGEDSMIIPYVTVLEGMRRASGSVRLLSIRTERDPATGDALVYRFSMTGLKPGKKTGVLVTADLGQAGKKLEHAIFDHFTGEFPFPANLLVGPFGPFEVRLDQP
jgi:hypothetical protein